MKRFELSFTVETTIYVTVKAENKEEALKEWERIKKGGDYAGSCIDGSPVFKYLREE